MTNETKASSPQMPIWDALDQALRQWRMYSEIQNATNEDLETADNPEGSMYRDCKSALVAQPCPQMPDREALKANVRAFRYPNGHGGVSDREYMAIHRADAALIDWMIDTGYIATKPTDPHTKTPNLVQMPDDENKKNAFRVQAAPSGERAGIANSPIEALETIRSACLWMQEQGLEYTGWNCFNALSIVQAALASPETGARVDAIEGLAAALEYFDGVEEAETWGVFRDEVRPLYQAARGYLAMQERAPGARDKPTIQELEALLNSEDNTPVRILPNGEVVQERAPVAATVPDGWKMVPEEPAEVMWSGLARDIIMGRDLKCNTQAKMRQHLVNSGHTLPPWLMEELGFDDAHLAKGDIAVLVYKAMLAAAPEGQKP